MRLVLAFCSLLGLVAGIATRASAADPAPLPITIGIQTDADWLTIAARENPLFEKVGLAPNFIKFTAGAPMMAAAQSRSIDVATPGLVPFLAGIGAGIPWTAIGIKVDGPAAEGVVAREGSGIKTLADLKGKRIGYFRASTSHYGLFMALKQNNIKPEDVTLLSLAPVQQVAAMRAGQIDASEVWDPWMHTLVADAKGRLIATEQSFGVRTAAGLYAVRRDWLASHHAEALRLIQAIVMAYDLLQKDSQGVIKQFASDTGIKEEWSASIYKEAGPTDPHRWLDPKYDRLTMLADGNLHAALVSLAAFLHEQKIVDKPVDVSGALDPSIISEVLKTAGAGK